MRIPGFFAPLLDRFVCVRVVNAHALDLAHFQFDFDLTFMVLFFQGDNTVYGRYGSWAHQRPPQDETTEGFRKGDLIIEVAGARARETESALIGRLLRQHRPGKVVKVAVLRDRQRLDLVLPRQ